MTRLVVTGGGGFLGWHLRCRLRALRPTAEVVVVDRASLDGSALDEAVAHSDAVVHLAAANRGPEHDVAVTNRSLATKLVAALRRTGCKPTVVYSDTTHRGLASAYGQAKRWAGEHLQRWGASVGAPVTILELPNLFGEHGRPFYNSAVATFCHQLVVGEPSNVNPEGRTELLHAQDAAQAILDAVDSAAAGLVRVPGVEITIPDLYARLATIRHTYGGATFPPLPTNLDRQLFNTLRSYLFPDAYPMPLAIHGDDRGEFWEIVRGHGEGQTSMSATRPGVTRGEHFHLDKIERFAVVRGRATIQLRRLLEDLVHTFEVDGANPTAVDLPTLHTHNITNVGDDDLITLLWANDHFDPLAPDTYPERVRQTEGKPA